MGLVGTRGRVRRGVVLDVWGRVLDVRGSGFDSPHQTTKEFPYSRNLLDGILGVSSQTSVGESESGTYARAKTGRDGQDNYNVIGGERCPGVWHPLEGRRKQTEEGSTVWTTEPLYYLLR